MKKTFDNEMLITRIKFLEKEIVSQKGGNVEADDYKLNYNTKENYVEHLHEKIRLLQDQIGGNNFSEKMMETERLR